MSNTGAKKNNISRLLRLCEKERKLNSTRSNQCSIFKIATANCDVIPSVTSSTSTVHVLNSMTLGAFRYDEPYHSSSWLKKTCFSLLRNKKHFFGSWEKLLIVANDRIV